jgi:hypothetical protein
MKDVKKILTFLAWIAGVVVVLLVIASVFEQLKKLRDGQKHLSENQNDLARAVLAKPTEPLQLTDSAKEPKGLMGFQKLPPEPLPQAPS